MREHFVNEFMAVLSNKLTEDALIIVYQSLTLFVSNYEIGKRNTEVVPYTGYLPECYETYFVTRKIEGMSMKSLELYNLVLKDFFFKLNKEIGKISTNDIRVYLYKNQQERNLSNSTLDTKRTIIHAFFEWAANEGYIGSNPCRNIKPIKYERPKRKPLTGIELEKVRNACDNLKDKALLELFYSTGCRVTEMERLDISDIDFQTKEVLLFGKGDKHRISYLNAKAEIAIRNYLDSRKDNEEALFVSDRKPYGRLKKPAIEKRIRVLGEKSGIGRRLYPHLIRHTTVTTALDRGMNIVDVSKLFGHESVDTTMEYITTDINSIKTHHMNCVI